ncbi:MAG TPA: metalloregulator ArsR/SmtB family transcription factor [Polyangiaceae bacterium]|nr:metalloregulator ArsR/SmtB family transcription factor [Polyangiaceae bacterium]
MTKAHELEHEHRARKERDTFDDDAYERAAAIFSAAGDVSRLRLLVRLSNGEWCVSELASLAGANMSTVSQQLRLLRSERLVSRRREGTHVYYALADGHIRTLIRAALEHATERSSSTTRKQDDDGPQDTPRPRSRSR